MESTFSDDQYALTFPRGIERYYWHLARNAVCTKVLARAVPRGATTLDIGCGPGILVEHLRASGWDAYGVDTGTPRHPRTPDHLWLGADAFELEPGFRQRVKALTLLDVLEHLDDPHEFLERCTRAFPNAPDALVTVPARPELWSNYDEHFGHKQRFTQTTLAALFERGPFELVDSGYFFHALYVPALAQTRLLKQRTLEVHAPASDLLHRIVARAFILESALLPKKVPGTSLYALVRRR